MPNRNQEANYRYGYQGEIEATRFANTRKIKNHSEQYAEKEELGGTHSFELRLWDARIGRWLSPYPKGQYASPYLGMGNRPQQSIDPDGGCTIDGKPCPKGFEGTDDFGLHYDSSNYFIDTNTPSGTEWLSYWSKGEGNWSMGAESGELLPIPNMYIFENGDFTISMSTTALEVNSNPLWGKFFDRFGSPRAWRNTGRFTDLSVSQYKFSVSLQGNIQEEALTAHITASGKVLNDYKPPKFISNYKIYSGEKFVSQTTLYNYAIPGLSKGFNQSSYTDANYTFLGLHSTSVNIGQTIGVIGTRDVSTGTGSSFSSTEIFFPAIHPNKAFYGKGL